MSYDFGTKPVAVPRPQMRARLSCIVLSALLCLQTAAAPSASATARQSPADSARATEPQAHSTAPTFRSSNPAANQTAATSISITKPSGVLNGDVLIAWISPAGSTFVINSVPSGWTQIDQTGPRGTAYYKVANSEPASYVWGFSASVEATAIVAAWSGVNQADPILAFRRSSRTTGDHVAQAPITGLPHTAGLVAMYAFGRGSTTTTGPTGWGPVQNPDSVGTNASAIESAMYHLAYTGGALPSPVATTSNATGDNAVLLALRSTNETSPLVNVANATTFSTATDLSSQAAAVPVGAVVGDLLVAFVHLERASGTPAVTATGWTVKAQYDLPAALGWTAVLYHRVAAGDPANHTFAYGLTATAHGIVMVNVRDAAPAGEPFAAIAGVVDPTTDTSWTVPGLTMPAQQAVLLSAVQNTRGDHTIASGAAWPSPHRDLAILNGVGSTAGFTAGVGARYGDAANPASLAVTAQSTLSVLGVYGAIRQDGVPAAPSTPDLAAASDTGSSSTDNITNDATPTLVGTADPGATVTVYDGANPVGSGTATGGNWSITTSSLADGARSLTAQVGSIASPALVVTVDTAAPAAPSTPELDPASDSGVSSTDDVTNVTTPTFTGTAEAGSTVRLYADGVLKGSNTADGSGAWTVTTTALTDGVRSVTTTATDSSDNASAASAALSVTIDSLAPAAPSTPDLEPASDSGMLDTDNITSDSTPTLSGTAETGATATLYEGSTFLGSGPASGGAWSITTSPLAGGGYGVTAVATDPAGNSSPASAALTVTIDLDDPNLLMGVNEGAIKSSSRTVEIELQADDATADVVAVDASNDNVAFTAVSGATPVWTLSPGDGVKTVWVRVTDTAGRTTTLSDAIILDSTQPAVTLDTTSISVTMERGTSRQEAVTITPSLVLYGATLDLSPSLAAVIDPPVPAGSFKAMDEIELGIAVSLDVPQSTALGAHSGTLTVRASDGMALGTVNISVTVVDPPLGTVPTTVSMPSSDRLVVDADGDTVVIDTLVVGLGPNTVDPAQRILAIASAHGGIVRGQIPGARMYQVQVPGTDDVSELEALRQSLETEADVAFASASYDAQLADVAPNDTEWQDVWDENAVGGRNWSMELIKMPTTWQFETGDRSVPVAIVDVGMDFEHPDLAANVDIYNDDLGKRPPGQKHGTHVSGIACAVGNNNLGVTGVAWECSLRGYEIGGANRHEQVTAMMRKAAEDGARVVNISAGRNFHNEFCNNNNQAKLDETTAIYRQAIQSVIDEGHDVLWVIAAGREPCDAALTTPGNLSAEFPNVMSVASVNNRGELSNFSPRGATVTVAAAGGKDPDFGVFDAQFVLSTVPVNCGIFGWFCANYGMEKGTSMAAPQVTGLAALVLSSHPGLTATEVKDCIVTSANANGAAIAGEAFHVVHAPSAVGCGGELLTATNDQWRTLELSWAGGVTNPEPAAWKTNGFDDSGWSDAYIPPDPYPAWVDISIADWLSSTGRETGHLTSEIWIARQEFEIPHPIITGATLIWNVDNTASVWINGHLVANGGTWTSVTTTAIPAEFLQQGTNTIAVKVFQDGNTNNWSVNPTFIQAKLVMP